MFLFRPKASLIFLGIAALLAEAGCSSSSPTPSAANRGDKEGPHEPSETVSQEKGGAQPKSKDPNENETTVAALAALEMSGANITRKEGRVIRVDLGPAGGDADLALVSDIPTLEYLTANTRGVTDKGLEKLKGHPALKTLDLTQSEIKDAGLAHLSELPKIEEVNLKRCNVTAAGYVSLAKVKTIKRIRAAQTNFDGDCLAALKDCTQLELLDLQDCSRVPIADWKTLENFKKLKFLRLWGSTVQDGTLDFITGAESLRVLSLDATDVGEEGLKKVTGLTNIQELYLNGSSNVFSPALAPVGSFKKLAILELRSTSINSKGMPHLSGLSNLKVLDLSETAVADEGLASLKDLTNMENLNLYNTRSTDAGLVYLQGMKKLKRLNLDKCKITQAGTPHLSGFSNLEYLHIGSTQVNDTALEPLGELKNLKELVITFLPDVSDEGVKKLQEKLPGLKNIKR